MNNVLLNEEKNIKDLIYEIRGKQVMLDKDLAMLYNVETKRINEAVKNNPLKFPERYSWKLVEDEFYLICSRPKISTLNKVKKIHLLLISNYIFLETYLGYF